MAIKGKKKSQSRGSQGQRRPAAAPRPVYTGRKHTPWYKTNEGRLIGGMLIAVIVGVTIWLVADAQNESKQRTETRTALEEYVKSVRAFTNALGPVAEEMSLVDPANPDVEQLAKDARKWSTDLADAQARIAGALPPDEAEVASRLFEQSMSSFLAAARAFEGVAEGDAGIEEELLAQAVEEREQARALFDLGVVALDEELQEVGGSNSNLLIPQGTPPSADPNASPGGSTQVIPVDPDGGDDNGGGQGGGGQNDGGGGGGDQGDGN